MFNTFNMGVGMSVIVDEKDADKAVEILKAAGEDAYVIGRIIKAADPGQKVILCEKQK